MVAQANAGKIKMPVISISNTMPDQITDQNTTQPPYRLTTCFSVISSLTPEQGIHDQFSTGVQGFVEIVTECGAKTTPNQEKCPTENGLNACASGYEDSKYIPH